MPGRLKALYLKRKGVVVLELPCDERSIDNAPISKSGRTRLVFQRSFMPVPGREDIEVSVQLTRHVRHYVASKETALA
jgi:hypothetical protein